MVVKNDDSKKKDLPIPADVSIMGDLFDPANAVDDDEDEIQEIPNATAGSKERISSDAP